MRSLCQTQGVWQAVEDGWMQFHHSPRPGVHRPAAAAVHRAQPVPEAQGMVLHDGQHYRGVLLMRCNMQGSGTLGDDQPPALQDNSQQCSAPSTVRCSIVLQRGGCQAFSDWICVKKCH